ncbi:MAG: ArsR family transcriptional regulator [Methanocalculaceae archaeon]|jgi:ArsR family transcriptional regulator|nr:ArsR family transcriptional regulator [Methanocalculaceae archaeon]
MIDQDSLAHLLDILGNRNRRRIIDLLRQKPCFVTEISDRLIINPKAVIEHLAIMQKENVISFYQDEKRRKYYYLVRDFELLVQMTKPDQPPQNTEEATGGAESEERTAPPLIDKILMIRRLLDSREKLIDNLESVEKDIDELMNDVIVSGRSVFQNSIESEIFLALVYAPLTPIELSDTICHPIPEVTGSLRMLAAKGYVESEGGRYRIKGTQKMKPVIPEPVIPMNLRWG